MKKITSLLLLLGATLSSYAQQVLTLDSCRALALANNKEPANFTRKSQCRPL